MNVPKLRFKEFNDEWKILKLSNISNCITKGTTPKKYSEEGINFIKVENIHNNIISNINSFISNEVHNIELKRSILQENDIVFSIAGALGRAAIIRKDLLPANTNQACSIIRLNSLESLNLNYLINRLNNIDVKNYIFKCQSVGAQPNLSLEQVCNIKISLPTKEEQEKIGKLLSLLDKKVELQTKKIEDLKLYKKGLIKSFFLEKDLTTILINNLGKIITGTTPSKSNINYWNDGNIIWVTPTDITENRDIDKSLSKITEEGLKNGRFIPKNSILVTCIASIGKNAVLKVDGSCNQQINAIIPNDNYNSNYIYYLMGFISNYMKSIAGTSATSIINKDEFSKIPVKVHSKARQDYIDSVLSRFENKILLENTKLSKLIKLKKGLMQNMFV